MRWGVGPYLRTGVLMLVLLVAGFGGWSVSAQITGAVIAPGRVVVDRHRQVVQHAFGGTISEIRVRDGDRVAKGDLLIRLEASDLRSDLAIIEAELADVLARRALFEAERDDAADLRFDPALHNGTGPDNAALMAAHRRLFAQRRDSRQQAVGQLAQQRAQIASLLAGIAAQQGALVTQQGLVAGDLADQQSLLSRGLTPTGRVLALEREAAQLAGRAGELTAQAAQAEARMTEIDLAVLALASTQREAAMTQLQDLQIRQFDLAERGRMLRRHLDRRDLRAPVAGIIHDQQVFAAGAVIRAAEPVLYIIPQDRAPVIAADIAAGDIDQIRVGQPVTLRFAAFEQHAFPQLAGMVTRVSADALQDAATGAYFYRAEVRLTPAQIASLPPGTLLLPGMPVDVFASTGSRRPIDYLFAPLTGYFTRAFRDG